MSGGYRLGRRRAWSLNTPPIGFVEVDWSHPIAQGLQVATVQGNPKDIATGKIPAGPGTIDVAMGGRAQRTTGSGAYFSYAMPTVPPNATGWTHFAVVSFGTAPDPCSIATYAELPGSGTLERGLYVGGSPRKIGGHVYDTGAADFSGTSAISNGEVYALGLTQSTSIARLYVNGVQESTQARTTSGYTGYASPELVLGYGSFNGTTTSDNYFYAFYHWFRVLSADEMYALSQNPYQILRPLQRWFLLGPPAAGVGAQTVTPTGIASAEAIGAHTVTPGAVAITGAGAISTGEAIGSATLSATVTVTGAGAIGTAEAIGSATLSTTVAITGAGAIASAEAIGSATVSAGGLIVSPTAIASAEAIGSAVVTPGAVTVSPTAISGAEAFGAAVVSAGGLIISPSGITSAEIFGTAVVTPGAVTLSPSGIATGEAIGSAVVSAAGLTLSPSGIAGAEAFGTAVLTTGPVTVSPSGIVTGETFGSAVVSAGAFLLSPTGIASGQAIGSAVVTPGAFTITGVGAIASAAAFGAALVSSGQAFITGAGAIVSAEAIGGLLIPQNYTAPAARTLELDAGARALAVEGGGRLLRVEAP